MPHLRCQLVCLGLFLIWGCGADVYEERLKETNAFFEYRQSLDRVLQNGQWSSPTTVSMRIPKGFNLMPAPPPAKEGEAPPVDSRQPFYLQMHLPGLIGAWQGEFPCDDGNRPAYLYVCSNHEVFQNLVTNSQGADPALFLSDLENSLSTKLGVALPPGEGNQIGNNVRYAETCPRDGKYAIPKRFTGITFVPSATPQDIPVEIKAQLYEHYNGPIQVAILVIYPASIRERLETNMLTALETFNVTNTVPKAAAGTPAGAGGGSKAGF